MKRFFIVSLIILSVIFGGQLCRAGAIDAEWSPFEFGIFTPVQIFDEESNICFLRLSAFYTKNRAAYGFDFGFINDSTDSAGLQIAVLNLCRDSQMGLGIGLINFSMKSIYGCQIGAFNKSGTGKILDEYDNAGGVQIGWVNLSKSIFSGVQIGIANLSTAKFSGLQLGFVNSDRDHNSFDKVLDYKDKADHTDDVCVQIGLLNFNEDGFLPISPFINF
ncbi:MAG: hypothetical protein L3J71_02310 [Victivallaceae bacterium]|nr:hypothetical protein [Victivallaceae bacterium]